MKKLYIFTILLIWGINASLFSQNSFSNLTDDTLRNYNPSAISNKLIDPTGYLYLVSRFEPKAPGWIKKLIITISSPQNFTKGGFTLFLYGHEAGSPVPQTRIDLAPPMLFTKQKAGRETVEFTLDKPVWTGNNQFFVGFGKISGGVVPMKDTTNHKPSCMSTSGGKYYFTFYYNQVADWYKDTCALAIDVIMDYPEINSPKYFQDVTKDSGIDTMIYNRTMSWADINNDFKMDLLVSGVLYRNDGNGKFTNINASSGVPNQFRLGGFIDMNNDGYVDIFSLNPAELFINNKNETFSKITNFKLPTFQSLTSYSIADINSDKYPDLFVGEWEVGNMVPVANHLLLNDKNNGFIDSTSLFYNPGDSAQMAPVRGSSFMDFNNDGQIDLYVANYRLRTDEFWKNNGNGTFNNIIKTSGIYFEDTKFDGAHGAGADWGDYDNDGDMDLLLPQLAHPIFLLSSDHRPTTIYTNQGAPDYNMKDTYKGRTISNAGIEYEETHAGAHWGDVNGDGLLDFIITTFYGCRYIDIYIQKPDHTFEQKSFEWGIDKFVSEADACFADYDNDGRLDLSVGNNQLFRLLKNNYKTNTGYVEIEVESNSCNTIGIGARIKVFSKGKQYMQDITSGTGAFMQTSPRAFFALPDWKIDSVQVWWPNKNYTHDTYKNLAYNNIYKLKEGGAVSLLVKGNVAKYQNLTVSPNPFSDVVNFNFEINNNTNIKIEIYNVAGQLIKDIEKNNISKNISIEWNGRNYNNQKVSSGIYVYKITTNNDNYNGKIILK